MHKLMSMPPLMVGCFHELTGLDRNEYYVTCDPVGHRLGSGGGTTWLLEECHKETAPDVPFSEWLGQEKRMLIHAGGQSRRLPAYAPSGKILTPLPVYRWERGQRLDQTLLDVQLPLYEELLDKAPASLHTMIVSGDVYVRATQPLGAVPEADVVCYGLWLGSHIAKNHGVFVSSRKSPDVLKQMLQKPAVQELNNLQKDHYYLTDIGVWLLSDRAVELLRARSKDAEGEFKEYDLYSQFGCALGTDPTVSDPELNSLTVAVLPLPGGEFYHLGTSRELISSMLAVQNLVSDQRRIIHKDRKPHPSIFVQNSITTYQFTGSNTEIWVENSHIPASWTLTTSHVITGVPENEWEVHLRPGDCIDVVPVGDSDFALRLYHIDDKFAGVEQQQKRFPVVTAKQLKDKKLISRLIKDWQEDVLYEGPVDSTSGNSFLPLTDRLSAEELSCHADLRRLFAQRRQFQRDNWQQLSANWKHSVFYQLDLYHAARQFKELDIPMPAPLPDDAPLMTRIHDAMFRGEDVKAFALLRDDIIESVQSDRQAPRRSVQSDQMVWGRSPVRIDIAGGWTDTPPYCLMEGGNVINLAIELNGQLPLQAYVRPCYEPHIVIRSIDLGAWETISDYEQLAAYNEVGSPFAIPKAALCLAGFHPRFSSERYATLKQQLTDFGGGFEVTLLSAVPKGSGLGTSSILAATVLGALSDFCSLGWDKQEICRRTLVLEQLLTTGGGWQDQFGGVLGGVKLLQTERGFVQSPVARWLPDDLYLQPDFRECHLLYYTGITRTAKQILAEIVRRMFLNEHNELRLLRRMKEHTLEMYDAIQRLDFTEMGRLMRRTWLQNQTIDSGTNPPEVQALTSLIDDLCLGYKLPGAGGGGYLYMVAKDPDAARLIRQRLNSNPSNARARFVEMTLSKTGLEITRS
jgi:galactokinase/mevalonate kinase-like predicted kinase